MPAVNLDTGDAAELAGLLQFLQDWFASDSGRLDESHRCLWMDADGIGDSHLIQGGFSTYFHGYATRAMRTAVHPRAWP